MQWVSSSRHPWSKMWKFQEFLGQTRRELRCAPCLGFPEFLWWWTGAQALSRLLWNWHEGVKQRSVQKLSVKDTLLINCNLQITIKDKHSLPAVITHKCGTFSLLDTLSNQSQSRLEKRMWITKGYLGSSVPIKEMRLEVWVVELIYL